MNQQAMEIEFLRGIEQFNRGEFYEAHETWEKLWLAAMETDKTFLQGMIQIAAAFHHCTNGNRAGAESLLKRGLKKISKFPADFRGPMLEELRAAVRRWLEHLATGLEPRRGALPRISLRRV